jgi:hypothetical protein
MADESEAPRRIETEFGVAAEPVSSHPLSRKRSREPTLVTVPLTILPQTVPSLFVPFVHKSMQEWHIARAVERELGIVERIDIVEADSERNHRRAYIHMHSWYPSTAAQRVRQSVLSGEVQRINTSGGHYMQVVMSKLARPIGAFDGAHRDRYGVTRM